MLPFDHPHVDTEIIMRFAMVCILPVQHPLAEKQVIEIEELRNEPFISLARDDCSLMSIDRAFQMRGVQKRNRIEVPLSETACGFVANGAGVSIAPPFVGLDYSDQIVRRKLLPEITMDVWLLTPNTRPPSLAAERLVDFVRAAVAPFDQRKAGHQPLSSRADAKTGNLKP